MDAEFDIEGFVRDVDAVRQVIGVSLYKVMGESGIPCSTLYPLMTGKAHSASLRTVVKLAVWADLSLNDYVMVY